MSDNVSAEEQLKLIKKQLEEEKEIRRQLESRLEELTKPPPPRAHGFLDYVDQGRDEHPPEKTIVISSKNLSRIQSRKEELVNTTINLASPSTSPRLQRATHASSEQQSASRSKYDNNGSPSSSTNSSSSSFYEKNNSMPNFSIPNNNNNDGTTPVPTAHGFLGYVSEGRNDERPEITHVGSRAKPRVPISVDQHENEMSSENADKLKNSTSLAHGFLDYLEQGKMNLPPQIESHRSKSPPPQRSKSPTHLPIPARTQHRRGKSEDSSSDYSSDEYYHLKKAKDGGSSSSYTILGSSNNSPNTNSTSGNNKGSWSSKDLKKTLALEPSDLILSGKCEEIKDNKRYVRYLILSKYCTLILASKKKGDVFVDFKWELSLKDCRIEPCLPICKQKRSFKKRKI